MAFTLLVAVMSFATPLLVRHAQLLKSQRDYRLALDEVSNQIDRLSALPANELPAALEQLVPSPFFAQRNPNARLSGELQPADFATQLTIKISWDELQNRRAPVSLTTWIVAAVPLENEAEGSRP